MSDLNEKLAQEAAELINGGEWRDGKWYSDGHRDAWRRALKPATDRIEKLEAALREISSVSKVMAKSEDMAQALTTLLSSHRKIALAALEGKDD